MRALLDVSVLVALLDRQHISHRLALAWLADHLSHGWASCPLTENGCIRVLTSPKYPATVEFAIALKKLEVAKASGFHEFWPDDLSITDRSHFQWKAFQGHRQITDAYLLGLAVRRNGRFVTFDQRVGTTPVRCAKHHHLVLLE